MRISRKNKKSKNLSDHYGIKILERQRFQKEANSL